LLKRSMGEKGSFSDPFFAGKEGEGSSRRNQKTFFFEDQEEGKKKGGAITMLTLFLLGEGKAGHER